MEEHYELGFDYVLENTASKQGAEARIFKGIFLGRPAIVKERFKKRYRHNALDYNLNKMRLRNELKGIAKAQQLGVGAPALFFVDNDGHKIIMEYIDGTTSRDWIEEKRASLSSEEFHRVTANFGELLGRMVSRLHAGNLVHGDLTTSNVLLRDGNPENLVFIDFGLSNQGKVTAEEKGVDLYVLERAMESTHVDSQSMFEGFLRGYTEGSKKQGNSVIEKLNEIRLRGRKRDMIG